LQRARRSGRGARRAAGVPARVVAGIAYANDGFYYHAWNEVWLDRWVSVDAVFDQMPATPRT
jgi:transglutaminase-like putative cysteine protease